jgi:hypothetical protein
MDSCGGSGAAAEVGPSAGGAIDDAMRLLAGVVFFADGLFGLCAAVFAGVFEDVFLAGVVLQPYLPGRRSALPASVVALLGSELMASPPR